MGESPYLPPTERDDPSASPERHELLDRMARRGRILGPFIALFSTVVVFLRPQLESDIHLGLISNEMVRDAQRLWSSLFFGPAGSIALAACILCGSGIFFIPKHSPYLRLAAPCLLVLSLVTLGFTIVGILPLWEMMDRLAE